mgnify:FL=1
MNAHFVEFPGFTEVVEYYLKDDESYFRLQTYLAHSPEMGSLIAGTGGIRKLRWPDSRRGKGKRSGLRVWYLYIPSHHQFLMIDIYDKDEADDLSSEQKRRLSRYVSQYLESLEKWRKGP